MPGSIAIEDLVLNYDPELSASAVPLGGCDGRVNKLERPPTRLRRGVQPALMCDSNFRQPIK
jgi:hypothetical protein